MEPKVQRKCSNVPTATTPDDGRQAETCSVRQSVMQHARILMKLKQVSNVKFYSMTEF
jgi:hypothetical protein